MLDELGIKFGTDKSSKRHNYLHFYEKHLSRVRGSVSTVMEIGVFNGASLSMWAEYFPQANIIGCDIKKELVSLKTERIDILIGNQEDPEFLINIARKIEPDVRLIRTRSRWRASPSPTGCAS